MRKALWIFVAIASLLVVALGAAWRGGIIRAPWSRQYDRLVEQLRDRSVRDAVRPHMPLDYRMLRSDGKHLWTDVVSTLGVLAGVLLAVATGIHQLDAILAALVAVNVLWSGWQVLRKSVIGLMDVAVDPKQLTLIKEIIAANADGAIEAHDIRTRQAGKMMFIEFHLVVPGAMTVEAAHTICDRIEATLREAIDEASITIHVEPEEKAKHSGIVVV